ncbi:Histone H2A [Orchesella cincta]|uniref:Histone H2A n=1 Tax=Orchesella cincta TaxID=48709 RepID=A0A1D2M2E4_ORCCI|nr:Histone H2A [Orchesella cincta]
MSGRGKGGKVKGKAKSRSSRAGLQFPWVVSIVSSEREITLSELELELQSTSLPLWSTWPLSSRVGRLSSSPRKRKEICLN